MLSMLLLLAEAFAHLAGLSQLQSLEVSGWIDPGASASWGKLRHLSSLTSLTLTSCQHPRWAQPCKAYRDLEMCLSWKALQALVSSMC